MSLQIHEAKGLKQLDRNQYRVSHLNLSQSDTTHLVPTVEVDPRPVKTGGGGLIDDEFLRIPRNRLDRGLNGSETGEHD